MIRNEPAIVVQDVSATIVLNEHAFCHPLCASDIIVRSEHAFCHPLCVIAIIVRSQECFIAIRNESAILSSGGKYCFVVISSAVERSALT